MQSSLEQCDHCGSARLEWRKCKQVCADCGNINRSCADLMADAADGGRAASDA